MKFKTFLFEFLVFPNEKKQAEIHIKAQDQDGTAASDEAFQDLVRSIAAKHIPEMNPTSANPGKLLTTAEEDPPVEYFRDDKHPGVAVWESNRGFKSVA